MFVVNEDNSIYVTRGDAGTISVTAKVDGANYVFKAGDVVRFKVTQKKACENVVLQKDFPITVDTEIVDIYLSEKDTKIGDVISKPVDYWYEVELNPFTNPQTIIGYDDDGAKIFKLHPEGRDLVDEPTTEEEIPVVDTDLSLTSSKPVENKVIARAVTNLNSDIATLESKLAEEKKTRETQQATLNKNTTAVSNDVNVLNSRMNTFTALEDGSTTGDAELIDIRVGANGQVYPSAGESVRGQFKILEKLFTMPTQEAVNKWLDEHPEATTTVQDKSLTIDKMVLGTLGYVTPEMYGAVGDGVTDDTEAIQQALTECRNVRFDTNKIYGISTTLNVPDNITIDLCGSTIKNITEAPFIMLQIEDVENVIIKNGKLHNVWLQGHESGNFIVVISSSQHITLDNLYFTECKSDAVYIGYKFWYAGADKFRTAFITVRNCHIDGVGRNGVSLVSGDNVLIENNVFEDINDNAPKSGIDIEPETGTGHHLHIVNAIIKNNVFKNCLAGINICSGLGDEDCSVYIKDNVFDGSTFGVDGKGNNKMYVELDGATFKNIDYYYSISINNNRVTSPVVLKNIVSGGSLKELTDPSYFGLINISSNKENVGNITIDGVTVLNENNAFPSIFTVTGGVEGQTPQPIQQLKVSNFTKSNDIPSCMWIIDGILEGDSCDIDIDIRQKLDTYYLQNLSRWTDVFINEITNFDTLYTLNTRIEDKIFTIRGLKNVGFNLNLPNGYVFANNETATKAFVQGGTNLFIEYMVHDKKVYFFTGANKITYIT